MGITELNLNRAATRRCLIIWDVLKNFANIYRETPVMESPLEISKADFY